MVVASFALAQAPENKRGLSVTHVTLIDAAGLANSEPAEVPFIRDQN